MRFPNLRYGNPNEFVYYASFIPTKERVQRLARQLRRSDRTIRDWLSGEKRIPWWVPEIMRLQYMEHCERMRQMNMKQPRRLGVVSTASILEMHTAKEKTRHEGGKPQEATVERQA